MLTKLSVRNFKRFDTAEIELGSAVVFIGPNNSGKTSALQALALWDIGLRRWNEKRKGKGAPKKRPGVTINRRDLLAVPVPDANLLWRNLHVRDIRKHDGKPETTNIRIDIIVEGITESRNWACGLEFDYANEESIYCRPLRTSEAKGSDRMLIPVEAEGVRVAFLPPMSGLAANETRLDQGAINVRVGEGRTAEILRNLCHMIFESERDRWQSIVQRTKSLFGVELDDPKYVSERGEITMTYRERGALLDLSSSGRGLQQTLLILAYMHMNPGATLLLDEPDAHLEILRQRQIYQLLTEIARENNNQIVAASHSEVLLNEAADRDVVVGFVGKPHRIDDRGSQVAKSLKEIGFEDYYLAETTGWVLYLEGSTDLAILQAFARKLNHSAAEHALERPFVKYVGNRPMDAQKHFHGLREAVPQLVGVGIWDHLDQQLPPDLGAEGFTWNRREIENYLCFEETLLSYAAARAEEGQIGPLFSAAESDRRVAAMREAISEVSDALRTLGKGSPWDTHMKVSDDFLIPVFEKYFGKLGLPNVMAKKNFHELAEHVPPDKIEDEVRATLDAIVRISRSARPVGQT